MDELIKDFEIFQIKPGDKLIVRYLKELSASEFKLAAESMKRVSQYLDIKILLIDSQCEVSILRDASNE
jgi:hypothetical protein